ncbi:helix-turn-helix domain-containing protein [Mangrovihabitans endophyticus]|uniref:helix-turn-helix domain-containing protein n=1 Tax=Mangrovihabitans endophyticus TaxID=1751298 RepID=UPI001E2AD371|nr:helix-turn-helix domain-containing protein [Mangrovihabitans endophyticus]
MRDVTIVDLRGASYGRTAAEPTRDEEQVWMWIVHRGTWTLGETDAAPEIDISQGRFHIRQRAGLTRFETSQPTVAHKLMLPAASLAASLRGRTVSGATAMAEVRLLTAHATMIHRTLPDLGPAGVQAARDTMLELVTSVIRRGLDGTDSPLAAPLTATAKNLVEQRLAEADLSPTMVAGELHVSLRTLQRAFADENESVATYIRNRRLDQARLELTDPRASITELAARWHFADSSHLSRAFKRRYGQTPTAYLRQARKSRRLAGPPPSGGKTRSAT